MTQNQNESLNGSLGLRCPKVKFCGVRKVKLCVAETVCKFNTGAASKIDILESVGVKPGTNMIIGFRSEDETRVKNAERKSSMNVRMDRRRGGENGNPSYHRKLILSPNNT